jgi:ribonuclease Z
MGTKYRVANLVLWHTEDKDMLHRKERYLAEGSRYYSGNLFIPDDLEEIALV